MSVCVISCGSNLGDRASTLNAAVRALQHDQEINVCRVSRWYTTQPVGGPTGQGPFLNGAVRIETARAPSDLLSTLQRIEAEAGRRREQRWAARTLDLDLLLVDRVSCRTDDLTLPHPRMAYRRFVLEPAAEIAGDLWHPRLGATLGQLWWHLEHAADRLLVEGGELADHVRIAEALAQTYPGWRPEASDLAGSGASDPLVSWWAWDRTPSAGSGPSDLGAAPKLLIRLGPGRIADERPCGEVATSARWQGIPTLEMAELDAQAMIPEVLAAVAAVWPALGVRRVSGVE